MWRTPDTNNVDLPIILDLVRSIEVDPGTDQLDVSIRASLIEVHKNANPRSPKHPRRTRYHLPYELKRTMVVRPILIQDILLAVPSMDSSDACLCAGAEAYHGWSGFETYSVNDDWCGDREVDPSTGGLIGWTYSGEESLTESRPRLVFELDANAVGPHSVFQERYSCVCVKSSRWC